MERFQGLDLHTIIVTVVTLIMLYSLWLTRRLFQVERQLLEYNKRITILSESVNLNRDKIMLNNIERKQEVTVEELIGTFKDYPRGNE